MHGVKRRLAAGLVLAWAALAATAALGDETETRRRVRFNRGIVTFQQGDYEAAERLFDALVQEDPGDVAALYWLGLCRLQRNDYAAAQQAFEQVLESSPDYVDAKLDAAIALIGQDEYERSKTLLAEFIESGAGDPAAQVLAQFFLGVAEYKSERLEAALEAFDAAEAGSTSPAMLANIAWYRSWIYTDQGRLQEAAESFMRVGELSTNVDQVVRARSLAEQLRRGVVATEARPSQFQLRIDAGLSYDSNVVLLGDDTSLEVGLSTDDDVRFGLSTDVRWWQPVGQDWLVGLGGDTFHSWHGSLQEFNVQTYGGSAFVNYFLGERMTFGLQYEFDYSLVDNDAFLSRHRLTPSLRLVEATHEDGTARTATTVFYSYEPRDYHEELDDLRDNRDGKYRTVGAVQSFNIAQPRVDHGDPRWLSADVGYRFSNESTNGDNFDLTGHALSARVSVPLPAEWLFAFSGSWSWEHYWQPNTEDARLRNRDDFIQRYVWSVGRDFELDRNVTLSLQGQIAWTADDSNVRNRLGEAVFSYDRVIYGLTLSFYFR